MPKNGAFINDLSQYINDTKQSEANCPVDKAQQCFG